MDSVNQFYAQDHDRLDGLLAEYRALKGTDHAAAKERFKAFLKGLSRHIVWEEDILFPLFEERTGMRGGGPTAVMRAEHRMIQEALDALHQKVRAADPDSDREVAALLAVLGPHNMKEENILYPMIDGGLDDAGRAAVKAKMDAVPEGAFGCGCAHHGH